MFQTAVVLALDLSPAEAPLLDCIGDLRSWGVTRLVTVHIVHRETHPASRPCGRAQSGHAH